MNDVAPTEMNDAFAGGCLCGAVRYRCQVVKLSVYCCHCRDCQKRSGGAFAEWAVVARDSFIVEDGAPVALRHGATVFWSCPNCGVRLWAEQVEQSDIVYLAAGALCDTSHLLPVAHIWTKSAQPWIRFNDDATLYQEQPADFRVFITQDAKLRSRQN